MNSLYRNASLLAAVSLLAACSSESTARNVERAEPVAKISVPLSGAISAATRQYNNNRTGANLQETVLTPQVVGGTTFHKLFALSSGVTGEEGKVEGQPIVVANVATSTGPRDLVIVCTMLDAVFAYDANDGTLVWQRVLGTAVDSADMDMWGVNKKWGVSSTPVVDLETGVLYVVSFEQIAAGSRQHTLHALSLTDGSEFSSIVIQGTANGNKKFSTGTTQPWQKLRAGLSLLNAGGNKAVVIAFSMNGENVGGPGNGFVFAYDVRGLLAGATGFRTPAIWTPTPNGGSGGIWMAGGAPAIEDNFIYFTTGNGRSLKDTDLSESFVKLAYTAPASSTVAPHLAVADYWTAFNDLTRTTVNGGQDQDLGSAGVVLVSGTTSLFGGGKDGVLYDVDRTAMGKWGHMADSADWTGINLPATSTVPFVVTYAPTTCANPSINLDCNMPQNTPDGMTHHIHGTPVFWDHGDNTGALYVWGENEVVKGYNYDMTASRLTGWFANGTIAASIGSTTAPTMPKPGGMPGGMLALSANGGADGVVWGTFPINGDANKTVLKGGLAAFDATTLALLWRSNQSTNGGVSNAIGNMSKFAPPLVINGKVYVSTYSNAVLVYGVDGVGVGTPTTTYPSMYLRGTFNGFAKQAAMGRLTTNTWTQTFTIKTSADCFKFDVFGDWAATTNFGGPSASSGTGVVGGPNICPNLPPGEYTITFNDSTKAWSIAQPMATGIPPHADAGNPITTTIGTPVMFDGTASSDSDGTIASYSWANDAFPTPLTGSTAAFTFTSAGKYTVVLTVIDDSGAFGTATVMVTVSSPVTMGGDAGEAGAAGASNAGNAGSSNAGASSAGSSNAGASSAGSSNAGASSAGSSTVGSSDGGSPDAGASSVPDRGGASGGCGCTVAGGSSTSGYRWLLATAAASLLLSRRRRTLRA